MNVRIELLGGFRVLVDGEAVPGAAWRRRRPAELVQLLALASGRRLHRDAVIEELWPRLDPKAGLANLHKAAHLARRAVRCPGAVVLEADQVSLWPGTDVEVDVASFEAGARRALRGDDPAPCSAAADLYAGDLLPAEPDRFDDVRQRLRSVRLELLRAAGRWDDVIDIEPTDEQAARALMREHLQAGDTEGAVRRFRHLHAALADLGLRPGPRTHEMYELALGGTADTRPAPRRHPLLGRAPALAATRRVLRAATAGEGGAVLVDGPPGIGKTRFALAVVDEVVEAGWTVVRAAGDADSPVPFSPVATALARLAAALPDLTGLLPRHTRAAVTDLLDGREGDRTRLFPAVATTLLAAAGSGVTVFLLDDAHAADDATIELMAHLANVARFEPLVLVLTFRTHEIPPALARLADGLVARRVGIRLRLGRLGADDAAAIALRTAPHEPSRAAMATIWQLAEGNPLFTEELAAAIGPDGTVPEIWDIPTAITARFDVLTGTDREGLQRLAVAGSAFSPDEVAAIVGADASGLLDRAIAGGLLAVQAGGVGFRHALVREALVREVPAHRRVGVHADVARRLVVAGAPAARIAQHAVAARRADAASWLRRAGEDAMTMAAYSDARRFAERGLEIAGDADRPALLELRGDAQQLLGDPAAGAAYRDALTAAAPAERVRLRIKLARACLAVGSVDAAARCVDGVEPHDPHEHAGLLLVRALLAWHRDDLDRAERLTAEARELAPAEVGSTAISEALSLEVMLAHASGQRRLISLPQWMEAYAAPALAGRALDPHLCIADYLLASDQSTATIVEFARRLADATAGSDAVRGQAFATVILGEAQLAAGDLDAARESLTRSLTLHRRIGWVAGEAIALEQLGELVRRTGDPGRADRRLEEALQAARWSPLCSHLLSRVHATLVRTRTGREALAAVSRAENDLADRQLCPVCSARFQVAAAVAHARAGEPAVARDYLGRVDAAGPAAGRGALGAEVTAARAELALASSDPDAASRLFVDAAGWLSELGRHPAARQCRDRAAGVAVAAVDPG